MERDNQKGGEELIDEEDLLSFELDDLSLEEMEKKASEFEDDIVELVDIIDKGPEGEEGEKQKDSIQVEEDQPGDDQEEFGFATDEINSIGDILDEESIDHSASELDLSGLSLSDLDEVPEPEPGKQKAEREIFEAELEEMLEDAPTGLLDLEFQEMEAPAEEAESDLEKQEEPAEALESDLVEAKESEVRETPEDGFKDELQETDIEDTTLDLRLAKVDEGIEIAEGELGDMLQEADVESVALDLEEEPAEGLGVGIDEGKTPAEVFNLDLERGLDLEEQKGDDIDEAAFEDSGVFPTEPASENTVGISEEVIEDIVSRVVQEVVERVTRETMIEVAEKLISEAIDALKQSIESISD